MTDNIIHLSGVKGTMADEPREPTGPTPDEILNECVGKYEDIIVIGITQDKSQCLSTMGLDEAVYELSRALHRLHCYIDKA